MNRRFSDTIPVRRPQELTPEQADALIRASWAQRSGSGLRLVQPIAAEACTEVDELPAADEYDMSHSRRSRRDCEAAGRFWSLYLLAVLLAVCAFVAQFWPA